MGARTLLQRCVVVQSRPAFSDRADRSRSPPELAADLLLSLSLSSLSLPSPHSSNAPPLSQLERMKLGLDGEEAPRKPKKAPKEKTAAQKAKLAKRRKAKKLKAKEKKKRLAAEAAAASDATDTAAAAASSAPAPAPPAEVEFADDDLDDAAYDEGDDICLE